MYTRVYQGRSRPVPEDYHGTAFAEQMSPEVPFDEEITEQKQESPVFLEEADTEHEEEREKAPPAKEKENAPPPSERQESKKAEDTAWSTELLLLALAALLVQNDAPDVELILVLMFLLLSPAT